MNDKLFFAKQKPAKCPACGSGDVVRIVYGLPTEEASKLAEAGRIALGGCLISAVNPSWQCRGCGTEVYREELRARLTDAS